MGTKSIVALVIFLIGFLSYSTFLKIKENAQKNFHVITWDRFDICFLIPDSFEIEKIKNGFKYQGGGNSGELKLIEGKVQDDYKKTWIGDFPSGYKKTPKLRLFQYQIHKKYYLQDTFIFAKKKTANIIPVRKNCSEYLKRFKKSLEL